MSEVLELFNVETLHFQDRKALMSVEARINNNVRAMTNEMLARAHAIGVDFLEVRDMLPERSFRAWLDAGRVMCSEGQAYKFMALAERFQAQGLEELTGLHLGAAYVLAQAGDPELIEHVIARVQAGDDVSQLEARQMVGAYRRRDDQPLWDAATVTRASEHVAPLEHGAGHGADQGDGAIETAPKTKLPRVATNEVKNVLGSVDMDALALENPELHALLTQGNVPTSFSVLEAVKSLNLLENRDVLVALALGAKQIPPRRVSSLPSAAWVKFGLADEHGYGTKKSISVFIALGEIARILDVNL